MKLRFLFFMLFISSATIQIHAMQKEIIQAMQLPLSSEAIEKIVRLENIGVYSFNGAVGIGMGALESVAALYLAWSRKNDAEHFHAVGTSVSVPLMLSGSSSACLALFSGGMKIMPAARVSAAMLGVPMLLNSLGHWINLKNSCNTERNYCIGLGVFTGIVGLAAVGFSLKK